MGFCVKLHPYLAEKCSDIIKLKIFENLRQSTVWQRHMCGQTDTKFLDMCGQTDTKFLDMCGQTDTKILDMCGQTDTKILDMREQHQASKKT